MNPDLITIPDDLRESKRIPSEIKKAIMERVQELRSYYTPSIEDIRIGYECESRVAPYNGWVPTKIEDGEEIQYIVDKEWELKTPYLTKEQIEAEGWVFKANSIDIWFYKEGIFEIGNWTSYKITLHYGFHDKRLYISADDTGSEHKLFEGKCRCINDFRFITKLLGI